MFKTHIENTKHSMPLGLITRRHENDVKIMLDTQKIKEADKEEFQK